MVNFWVSPIIRNHINSTEGSGFFLVQVTFVPEVCSLKKIVCTLRLIKWRKRGKLGQTILYVICAYYVGRFQCENPLPSWRKKANKWNLYTPLWVISFYNFIPDRIYDSFCYPNYKQLVNENLYNSLGNLPKAMGINSLANLSCMCGSRKVKVKPKK